MMSLPGIAVIVTGASPRPGCATPKPLAQQALVVFLLLIIKQVLTLWVTGIVGQAPDLSLYFLPSLVGAIVWPWVFLILRDLRRRFTQSNRF